MSAKPHIVIVGAGFGGVYAARGLLRELGRGDGAEADITIVSRDNYFLFTPLLYEVATGGLSPRSVVEPVAEIFRGTGVHFAQAEVRSIDLEHRIVATDGRTFSYDYLIIASGAETNRYGIPGVEQHTLMLKSLSDALALRRRVIDNFKRAAQTADPVERKRLLSFVIVGGGPTGVELAAELREFSAEVARSYYARALDSRELSVTLIAASPSLVPQFSGRVRSKALAVLTKKGVEVLLSTAVSAVAADGLETKDGRPDAESGTRFIPSGTTVWVAGIEASLPPLSGETHLHKSGRLMVNEFLQVEGHTDAFALGDGAILPMKDGEPPVPQLAQAAEAEAEIAALNIAALMQAPAAKLTPFTFHSKGALLSLGSWQAAGDVYGFHFSGPFMWFAWRTVYLFKFNSWRKRFSIMSDWTLGLFSPRDISEL